MSWMWGLGFFYSMHVVWVQGWTGFWVFALANTIGLALFGCVLSSKRGDPETLFGETGAALRRTFLAVPDRCSRNHHFLAQRISVGTAHLQS